jgi:hypothetical protein
MDNASKIMAIDRIDAQDKKYGVLFPLTDWPEIIQTVKLIRKELGI